MSAKELRSSKLTPQSLAIFAFKNEFILSVIAKSGGNRSCTVKGELEKRFQIEYIKHNQQLKINFLAGQHSMKKYRLKTFLACEFSVSLILCPRVVRLAHTNDVKNCMRSDNAQCNLMASP